MFFEQNVQAMLNADETHSALATRLQATVPTTAYQVFQAGDGACTLEYKNVFLHHQESPLAEARQVLETQCRPGHDRLHVILGLGMGYLLDEAWKASKGQIVVYEPDLPLLRFVLENINLSKILSSGRVALEDNQVDLLTRIRQKLYRQYQLDVLVLRAHAHLMAEEIPGLMSRMMELETDRIYDAKTGRAFHFQWLRQFLANLPEFAAINTLDELYGRFEGKPALVISRGPSLDGALDAIRELSDSAVLIAVGGALRRLWEAGITPDFAVFYDANGMQEQLHGIPEAVLENITFLVSPFSQPCVFTAPARGKLLFLGQNNAQFADWLDVALNRPHQRLDGGGTVSIIAFQAALAMGCNMVTLVGQDLAFPDKQVYAGGVQLEQDAQGCLALTPSEILYAQPETMATTTGQQGETLPTLKAYTSFIRHFEDLAVKNAQSAQPAKLYNASIGGARIDGFILAELSTLKPKFPAPWKTPFALAEALELSGRQIEERRLAFQTGLLDLKGRFQQALTLCEQLHQLLQVKSQQQPQEALSAIQTANRQFNDFMAIHPFVAYWLMFEMIDFREAIGRMNSTMTFVQQGHPALLTMLGQCQDIIRQKALPWVESSYQALVLQQHAQESQLAHYQD